MGPFAACLRGFWGLLSEVQLHVHRLFAKAVFPTEFHRPRVRRVHLQFQAAAATLSRNGLALVQQPAADAPPRCVSSTAMESM